MGVNKKRVKNVKNLYYYIFENDYKSKILEYVNDSKLSKDWKDQFILIPLLTRLSGTFRDEQIIGLRDEGFDYRYRCTERWWGYLDSIYRYEIERILEGGVDIGWHIERMRKVYGEEVWSEEIEEILRRVYERKDEVFNDMLKQRYFSVYGTLSMFFNKKIYVLSMINQNKKIDDINKYVKSHKDILEDLYNNLKENKNKFIYSFRYKDLIYRKEECRKVKEAYEKLVKDRLENLPSLYSHYKDFDIYLAFDYQLGVKQGYGDCIKDVTDNDKIVYKKEFLENPLFG